MLRLKLVCIAVAILCSVFLFGMVNSSQAAEITSFSVENGASGCYASLTTDADIWVINWHIKQTYPITETNEWVHTSSHPAGTTSVYENVGWLEGHIKIAEYDVKAEVFFDDAGGLDSDTTKAYAYGSIDDQGYKDTAVRGSAYLRSHHFNGSAIVMDGGAHAYNNGVVAAVTSGVLRHTALNKPLDELEKFLPVKVIAEGESVSYSTSDWGSDFFHFPTTLEGEHEEWRCNAYLRLVVHTGGVEEDWFAGDNNTFNEDDIR